MTWNHLQLGIFGQLWPLRASKFSYSAISKSIDLLFHNVMELEIL